MFTAEQARHTLLYKLSQNSYFRNVYQAQEETSVLVTLIVISLF